MILVVAPGQDKHAHAVVETLRARDGDVCWIDLAALGRSLRLSLEPGTARGGHMRTEDGRRTALVEVSAVWWRRPRLPEPPASLDEPARTYVVSEWEHFVDGIEWCTHAHWINPPQANRVAARKARQLVEAQRVGLTVPRTLMTNDPDAARDLAAEYDGELVYKRLGSAPRPIAATKPLLAADLNRLDSLQSCPAIFQQRIDARADIRITAIGDELWTVAIDASVGASPLDWRFDLNVPMRAHDLPDEVGDKIRALLASLDLSYAAVDMRLTESGDYVFLEVNPSGQYLFVELLAELPLTDRVATWLSSWQREMRPA